jgi:PPP family 3-phenylpropionic acid transporter
VHLFKTTSLFRRLSYVQGAHFIGPGIAMPFFPLWLAGEGLSPDTMGWILALPTFLRIATTPLITGLTDRWCAPAPLLIGLDVMLVALYALLIIPQSVYLLFVLCTLIGIMQSVTVPIGDAMTLHALRLHPNLSYGRVRVWGSISFLITTLIVGGLLGLQNTVSDVKTYTLIPILMVGAYALAALTAYKAPPEGYQRLAAHLSHQTLISSKISGILWRIMAGVALIQACHAGVYHFGSLLWQSKGASSELISLFWVLGVLAEIALFYGLSAHWQTLPRAFILLFIGCLSAVLRFMIMSFDPDLNSYYILQLLHAGSFGATHLASMALVSQLAPVDQRGKVQGLMAALIALSMGLATLGSGYLFAYDQSAVFMLMSAFALVGTFFVLDAWRLYRASAP